MKLYAWSRDKKGQTNVKNHSCLSGETEWNKSGIIQGQMDTRLSENGYNQALNVGKYLQNHKFDYVFSSDLERAHQVSNLF